MYMMNDYNTGGDDQYWFDNNITVGSSDNMAAAAGTSTGNHRSSSSSSSKPIRRRSRVSKKTPITLLNTDATNFRSLVQQFTGCPHPLPPTSTSFQTAPLDTNRGPLNLNFQLGTVQTSNHQQLPSNITGQSSSMVNYRDGAADEITRNISGGHNHMEMVQELLMVDDSQDDFGLFR